MVTEAEILSPAKMKEFFLINHVDAACVTLAYMNTLASIPDMHEALAQLKVIDFGAEAFPGALYTKLRGINPDVCILNGYGPTEATISCTVKEITSAEHITIGKPNANVYTYVVDEELNEVPHFEEGELLICGKGVGRGYRNLPEKTADVFVEYKGMRGYRTGDFVRLDENDEIEFVGRKDFQVKLRGLRIELGEVEEVVSSYPSVQLCAAAAVDNRFLVVYYTAAETIDPAALKEYAKQSLAHYMVPDIFMQLDTMPMTANRRIDRKALPHPEIHAEEIVPPATDTQKKILAIFTSVIDGMPQSITANIMELGVSSLDAMILISELAEAFDNTFRIADIYENPTVQKMEAFIQSAPKKITFVEKDRYPAAKREIFYYYMFGSDTTYNLCYCYELDASLDIVRLQNAITQAIDMHRGLLSRYEMTDGLFIANFISSTAYAAQNIIGNFLFFLIAVGVMFGSGGSALVSKTLGEGREEQASCEFSMMVWTALGIDFLLMIASRIMIRPMSELLGAEGQLLEDAVVYGSIAVLALPGAILQGAFQYFFTTAEKPVLGMLIGFGTSILNIVLDALFIIVFHRGIAGAAGATAISMLLAGIIPLCYFLRRNSSILRLRPVRLELNPLGRACLNGSSELLSTISVAIVGILYNFQLLRYIGEDGVAAYGAITMASTIFTCIFTGYGMGVTPVIGYHFGAKNDKELQNVFRLTCMLVGIASLVLVVVCYLSADLFASFYFGMNPELMMLSVHGLRIFAGSFLFIGLNIFGSTLFTALNNGVVSGILSTLRTLIFQVIFILLLPELLGIDGIWWAVVPAELCSLITVILFTIAERRKYHYY